MISNKKRYWLNSHEWPRLSPERNKACWAALRWKDRCPSTQSSKKYGRQTVNPMPQTHHNVPTPSGAVGLSVAQNTNSLNVVVVHRGYPATLVTDQHVADFRLEFRKKLCRLPTTSWPRIDSNFIEWHTLHFVPTCTWVSPHKDTHNGAAMLRDRGKNRRSWTTAYAQGYSQHTEPPSGNEGFTYQNQKLVHRPAYGQNLRTNLGTKSKEFVIKSTGDQIWIYGTPHLYPDSFTP